MIAVIAGTTQGVTAWLLGSSYAIALGVIAGLLDMIPNIGATIAGFILVPTLWAEEGITAAIIMLVVVLVYQQVENNILTPKIQGKAVNLSAFFIILAVTLFGALLGVLGALTAVPLAATIQIFVQELTKARRRARRRRARRGPSLPRGRPRRTSTTAERRRLSALAAARARRACARAAASPTALPLPQAPGCPVFPRDNAWNQRVDRLPVARDSAALDPLDRRRRRHARRLRLGHVGGREDRHPDHGRRRRAAEGARRASTTRTSATRAVPDPGERRDRGRRATGTR